MRTCDSDLCIEGLVAKFSDSNLLLFINKYLLTLIIIIIVVVVVVMLCQLYLIHCLSQVHFRNTLFRDWLSLHPWLKKERGDKAHCLSL
jgi:hypothetical protein